MRFRNGAVSRALVVLGAILLWVLVLTVVYLTIGQRLSQWNSIYGQTLPSWWRFSWIPWPGTALRFVVYALVAFAFSRLLIRAGLNRRLPVASVFAISLSWWLLILLFAMVEVGGAITIDLLRYVRFAGPLPLSATVGSLAGAVAGSFVIGDPSISSERLTSASSRAPGDVE